MRKEIMKSSKILLGLIILTGLFVWSGCSTPETQEKTIYDVVSVQQHPSEDVMLMEVDETTREVSDSGRGSRVDYQRAIYQCVRDGDDLRCHRTCGGEHECPDRRNIIRADRSASALVGASRSAVVETEESADPAEDEVSGYDDSDESAVSADDVEAE